MSLGAENNVAVRIVGRPFQKGQFGNPGGRPKGCEEVREFARSYTKEAIQTLALIMRKGKSEGARIAAANTLLERGWGRPLQQVEVKRSPLDGFTTGQLLAALEMVERALAVDSEKLVSEVEVKRSPLDGFTTGQLLAALEMVERALAVDSEKLVSELGRDFFPTTH